MSDNDYRKTLQRIQSALIDQQSAHLQRCANAQKIVAGALALLDRPVENSLFADRAVLAESDGDILFMR